MNLLTPKEMATLKELAAGNLESALLAAARFGATKSIEAAKPIKRAAEMLEFDAEQIKERNSFGKAWRDEESQQDYTERKNIAKQLRGMTEVK